MKTRIPKFRTSVYRKFSVCIYMIALCFGFSLNGFSQSVISGTLTDGTETLAGAVVKVIETGQADISNSAGQFQFSVPPGTYTLEAGFVGYESLRQNVSVADGETQQVTLNLSTSGLLDEVVVIGSRSEPRTIIESAVPIDVHDIGELVSQAPQTNLNQILNYVAPSFTSNTQTISDGTDHIDPASLRALGPDQVLVLINGKRRHVSSLVNVNGTFGRGNVGTDLNAIPAAAVDRIEVLRDGAAAQYGSDAIAGVMNIILKQDFNKLTASLTTGAYMSEGSNFFTGGSDGESVDVSLNYGVPLNDKGGAVNFTGTFETRDWTSRMQEWEGSVFNAYNAIEWVANQDGADLSNLSMSDLQSYAQSVSHFDSGFKSDIANAPDMPTLQGLLSMDVTDAELAARGQQRADYNMRVGQSELRGGKFFANMTLPINVNTEVYAFGGISNRDGLATGFYRLPNQNRTYTPAYLNGFLPQIHTDIGDKSLAAGITGKIQNWTMDFSNTVGQNSVGYNVENSSNATLLNATPFEFDAGGFSFLQNTTNFDMSRYWENTLSGLNLAFGAETRIENYKINSGNENSYAIYDVNGQVVTSTTPESDLVTDFFDRARPGGAQVFPGFRPGNELSEFRNSVAGYVDLEADFSEQFMASLATRFEDYSDFGNTLNFKVTSRYKATEDLSIRGGFNTGFRAPSLHQIYFNSTSTLFVDGIPNEVGTFSNNSRIARILGIPELKEETSQSISLGLTSRFPDANISITADVYQVDIDDRVVLTGTFDPSDGRTPDQQMELAALFASANSERATFFANAIDTRSQGLDIVISHFADLGVGALKTDLSGTFSKTEQVGAVKTSPQLEGLEDVYFDQTSRIYLESAVPTTKVNLTNSLSGNKFSVFLRNVYFGEVTEATNSTDNLQIFGGKVVTDLTAGYDILENTRLSIGANNLFDVYPDENIEANRSSGRFIYSRRSQQFGFMGRYVYGRLNLNLIN